MSSNRELRQQKECFSRIKGILETIEPSAGISRKGLVVKMLTEYEITEHKTGHFVDLCIAAGLIVERDGVLFAKV